jgi:hypothetical protein
MRAFFVFCYLRQRKEGFFTIEYLWGNGRTYDFHQFNG